MVFVSPVNLYLQRLLSFLATRYTEKYRIGNGSIGAWNFKRQPHKMVKHTQTIRRQQLRKCLSAFDHFVWLALIKGLIKPYMYNVEK